MKNNIMNYVSSITDNTPLQECIDLCVKQVRHFARISKTKTYCELPADAKAVFVKNWELVVKMRNDFISIKQDSLSVFSKN